MPDNGKLVHALDARFFAPLRRPALTAKLHRILDLAEDGIRKRGFHEEVFLAPLRRRADTLTNPALEQLDRLARVESIESIAEDYGSLSSGKEVRHA